MKYQQVPRRRLSSAADKLESDGAWRPLADAPRTYYRVVSKLVQRVVLEPGESDAMLGMLDRLAPLPPKALRSGFREELTLRIVDDRYALTGVLVRAFVGWDLLAHAAGEVGAILRHYGGNTLECSILFDAWTTANVARAMVLAKAIGSVGAMLAEDARQGIPHTRAEVAGLLRSACDVLLEDVADVVADVDDASDVPAAEASAAEPARRSKRRARAAAPAPAAQASLFTEST
jgi:hypothetical protein